MQSADAARADWETGIGQAEKFGHSGMAEDLRVSLVRLREQAYGVPPPGKTGEWYVGYH